jgi:formate dehydrogenase subunit gamma
MGGDALADQAEERLGVKLGRTRADGRVTLEPVYCLGLCATAPSAMFDDRPLGRLDAAAIERIAAEVDG